MNAINSLESRLARLYAKTPSLPRDVRRWIGLNAWWVILVIAIITSLVLLVAVPGILILAGSSQYSTIYPNVNVPLTTVITGAIINIVFSLVSVILLYMAIGPLRAQRRRGWELLFLNELLSVLAAIDAFIAVIQTMNFPGLILSLLVVAVEFYLLFQIRAEFGAMESHRPKVVEAEIVSETKQK